MNANSFGACTDLVSLLQEYQLLRKEELSTVTAYVRAFPQRGERELGQFLQERGILTAFQVEAALEDRLDELQLAQYTLVDIIGSGSMGTVYRARASNREESFAVKIVPRRNAVGLNTIAEKVKLLKDIRHPRVSALLHIGAQGERVYLVWPLVEGGERLEDFVRRHGKLTPRQGSQIALQIASGLQAYHQHGLFHGLLKPSDVLIGTDKRVRILDFGVGFLLASERGKSLLDTMTNTRTLARGVDCASPESLIDPLHRTPFGDQYSLGCILFFCLTGRFPFQHENPVKKMLAHQAEPPPDVRELNEEVTPKLASILDRLLAKNPEERFASTEELVQSLQSLGAPSRPSTPWMANPPALAPSRELEAPPAQESGWETRHLLLLGLAAGAFLGTAGWLLTRL